MTATVAAVQSVVTIANAIFGSEIGRAIFDLLKSRLPNLTDEEKATLDQHFTDYLGWTFPPPPPPL